MCGIVAAYAVSESVGSEGLKQAGALLRHRGPEEEGYWCSNKNGVVLGHLRLSIVDLQNGQQPLSNEDQTIHAVVNGEFYGYSAVRRDLEAAGHSFRTKSDSEIVIHLYETYGTECLKHLRGEFAFVLWDERRRVLFAARDRFGIKPLFYSNVGGFLRLASEVKSLFRAGVPAQWDYESVFQSSCFVMAPERTLFRGVTQIPPGHYLLASTQGAQTHQYWDFNYPTVEDAMAVDAPTAVRNVRRQLTEAVRLRLQADTPVACYLSGGLDSSAVLGVAAKDLRAPIHAFALGFEHKVFDESALARETAAHLGVDLTVLPVSEGDLVENFKRALWHSETFCFNSNGVGKYLLSKAVRDAGYKVVLTGEGADEIFAGYPHFQRDNILHGSLNAEQKTAMLHRLQSQDVVYAGLSGLAGPCEFFHGVNKRLGFVPSMWECTFGVSLGLQTTFTPDFRAEFSSRNPFDGFLDQVTGQLMGRNAVHQSMYLWSKTWLPQYILSFLGDRMEMAHSVEGRLPFLDHHLVESVAALPVSMKLRGETEKYLLRESTRDVLTHNVYARKKHAFAAPPAVLNRHGPLFKFVSEVLHSDLVDAVPFLDRKQVRKLCNWDASMSQDALRDRDATLMGVASACMLHHELGLN